MLTTLRINRDIAALESYSATDLQGFLKNILPSVTAELSNFVNRFTPEEPAIQVSSKQQSFLKELAKHSYMDIRVITAYVPEGMSSKYQDYGVTLDNAVNHVSKIMDGMLAPYSLFLSQLISNEDSKLSSNSFESFYAGMEKYRNSVNVELGAHFTKGSTKTDVTIGDVIARNNDWSGVFKNCDDMVAVMNKIDRKAINKKIKECSELLDIVSKKITRNELAGISPAAVTNLSNGAYQIASELEFLASIYYKTLAFSTAVNRTTENLTKIFER
jgi:hypothetical protein